MEIEKFYGKFPSVDNSYLDPYLNSSDNSFLDIIPSKQEFYHLKLKKNEESPSLLGDYYKHQKYISLFLSSNTGYDELLLFHEMGTGKTCTAVATIEANKNQKESNITGAVILARGTGLLNNFKHELMFICTDGRYIPENYDKLTDNEKTHRINKILKDFYHFHTFETFAKELEKMTDDKIIKTYNNFIFILDEVHNIKDKFDVNENGEDILIEEQVNIYNQLHRLCHILPHRKIILMSGTPMKDDPKEFASVMNLILPLSKQLPTSTDFIDKYFDKDGFIREDTIQELKNIIKGRTSYLKAAQSEIVKKFYGQLYGRLRYFIVALDYMTSFQSSAYEIAYKKDVDSHSIYNNSRQASLFVFPDGSWGTDGFNTYIKKRIFVPLTRMVVGKKKTKTVYEASRDLINNIKPLENLNRLSSKYFAVISDILNDKIVNCFVYCQYVNGSGLILFSKILEQYGYVAATGNETIKLKRYALITNQTASYKKIQRLINRSNQPDNIDGEYISILLGSKVVNEGFTFKNKRKIYILTPHWNYAETSQAIARGWRINSHEAMVKRGDSNINVNIYQCVSLPSNTDTASIDLTMYETSESKDILIKRVERVVKEVSFDCFLAYKRNKISGYDYQRECDYLPCQYICDGNPREHIYDDEITYLDKSTYDLNPSIQLNISTKINLYLTELFISRFTTNINKLILDFDDLNLFEIMTAINNLLNTETMYRNKYGFKWFLRMDQSILFISPEPRNGNSLESYYSNEGLIINEKSFDTVLNQSYEILLPEKIDLLFTDPQMTTSIISKLPKNIQRIILEACLISHQLNLTQKIQTRDIILNFYKEFYKRILIGKTETWLIYLYEDELGTVCYDYDSERFITCSLPHHNISQRVALMSNEIGFYGLYNPDLKEFCLRDVRNETGKTDLRKITIGRRCKNFNHGTLVDILARRIKIDPPVSVFQNVLEQDIKKELDSNQDKLDVDYNSVDSMKRYLYWYKQKREFMCDVIKDWFETHNLLEQNFDCGHQKKKRAKYV